MLAHLLSGQAFGVLLVFARVGAALMLLPGFSAAQVTPRIRLILGLFLSLLLWPVLADQLPPLPATPVALGLLLAGEVAVGAFLGALTRVLLAAVHVAGTLTSLFASLANALVQDPVSEQQASTIAGFLTTVAVLLIFVTGLHRLMLEALVASYDVFPAGAALATGDMADALARTVAASFALGLRMAMPFLIIGFTYTLGLGLLGRLMPQLPVFFFGLPAQISLQLWALMLTLTALMLAFVGGFGDGIAAIFGS